MQNKQLCVHENNPHFRKRRFFIYSFLLIALLLYSLFQLEQKVRPIASQIAAQQSKAVAIKAIQQACNYILNDQPLLYEDLYHIQRASDGRIQSVEINTLRVNAMEDALIGKVNESLSQLKNQPLKIPLGTLSGMQILNGYGPKLTVQIMPLSLVTSQVNSRFISVGVNQTKLEIYIHFTAEMGSVLAGFTQTVLAETDVIVAQVVIVGQVPQMYVQGLK